MFETELYRDDYMRILPSLPSESVDVVICDLPYGVTDLEWDKDHSKYLADLWREWNRLGARTVILTASQPFTTQLINSNPKGFKYSWVWEKKNCTNFANAKKAPLRAHEDILVFYDKFKVYNPQGLQTLGKPRTRTAKVGVATGGEGFKDGYQQTVTNYPKSILRFGVDERGLHPTQKPVALMEYLINTYTNPGEVVLDNCMGSGTTGVACVNTRRYFMGIERDPVYFDIALQRIDKAKECARKALEENSGN